MVFHGGPRLPVSGFTPATLSFSPHYPKKKKVDVLKKMGYTQVRQWSEWAGCSVVQFEGIVPLLAEVFIIFYNNRESKLERNTGAKARNKELF